MQIFLTKLIEWVIRLVVHVVNYHWVHFDFDESSSQQEQQTHEQYTQKEHTYHLVELLIEKIEIITRRESALQEKFFRVRETVEKYQQQCHEEDSLATQLIQELRRELYRTASTES